jgi:transcriptional regulator with XRE-family HTH domain
MAEADSPEQLLAQRLRKLREEHWPARKVTQAELAQALGAGKPLSVPLISSWESVARPTIPPARRLESYATFFATMRSIASRAPRLLDAGELTEPERAERKRLQGELLRLRADAVAAANPSSTGSSRAQPAGESARSTDSARLIESLKSGYWHFADGGPVTLVCAQVPAEMRAKIPYSDPANPDYVALYAHADLDAFVELHGHVRAANPGNHVYFRTAEQLVSDDYSTHLISLGGVDWNHATASLLGRLDLPVVQVGDWDSPAGPYFEVPSEGKPARFHPVLTTADGRPSLRQDVAMFARSWNPFNKERTATICDGMYASGTFGAVRALTDSNFRDRNTEYLKRRFGPSATFCLVTKVTVERGVPVTPDWTVPDNILFEWASEI